MLKCPACGINIQPGEAFCPSCGENMSLPPMGGSLELTDSSHLESVVTLENETEGPILQSVLEGVGIPSIIRNLNVVEYYLPEAGQTAWGELLVLQPHASKARIILDEYLRSLQEHPMEESPPSEEDSTSGEE